MKQFLVGFGQQVTKILLSHRTAIGAVASAILASLLIQLQAGHFSWKVTGLAALAVVAGQAKSAWGIQSTPQPTS